jgi:6-phosphofructokinase 1
MARIGVLTSGGDAPGMNAAIRAVVRSAVGSGCSVVGFRHGYTGLISADCSLLGARDVGGIIQSGGTMLGTTRCEGLRTENGRKAALEVLERHSIDALVVIGGNGSQSGAWELAKCGVPVVGVASTIDNDLPGTDISIGATTATDVALEAIDRLRVTAASMQRVFVVEVMGRHCGYLALMAGLTGGAESIVTPERDIDPDEVVHEIRGARSRGKSHAIVVVAEGATWHGEALLAFLRQHPDMTGFDLRITRLGHVQRGGAPGSFDRMLGTRFGVAAVEAIAAGTFGVLIGLHGERVGTTPLAEVAGRTRPADAALLELARMLAA